MPTVHAMALPDVSEVRSTLRPENAKKMGAKNDAVMVSRLCRTAGS